MASLRRRLIVGTALWSAGIFIAVTVFMVHALERHSLVPQVVHHVFRQWMLMGAIGAAAMIYGLRAMRRGFSPIAQLRERLGDVHDGRASRLAGDDYPAEVQPLVTDLNALLDARDATIARAQARAGDLAHGLKTPLALLAHEAELARAAGHTALAATLQHEIDRMRRQIDYHLAQARAAAAGRAGQSRTPVAESIEGLARTMARVHAARPVTIDRDIDPAHTVRVERQDLDEMLGNLLDNACKWAATRVRISSRVEGDRVGISVEDDGPGVPVDQRDAVLKRGVRADEAAPGSGLGLAIADDLARLYGGTIELDASALGGLKATLTLNR
jgi:signal transduction histidine kinase